jgi:shikimate dehydrogenase
MNDVYRYRRIGPSTRLIGIVGYPLGHSLSPHIHNRAFDALNLDFVFLKFPTPDVADFFENARTLGIEGFSVTIPHKSAVIPFLDELTPEARAIGAVNTVSSRDGRWIGDNTDVHGVHRCACIRWLQSRRQKRCDFRSGRGPRKRLSQPVKGAKSVEVLARRDVPQAVNRPCDLLINATPVGMFPMVDASPVSGLIPADAVFDMVYNPPITRLLRSALDQGKTAIQGTTMFLAQAARNLKSGRAIALPPRNF